MTRWLPRRTVVVAVLGVVGIFALDPLSVPAALIGILLGIFVGADLPEPPEEPVPIVFEEPVLGPIAVMRRVTPWTEPGFLPRPTTNQRKRAP